MASIVNCRHDRKARQCRVPPPRFTFQEVEMSKVSAERRKGAGPGEVLHPELNELVDLVRWMG